MSYYCILFFMFARSLILTGGFFLITYFSLAQGYQHFYNEAKKALEEKHYPEFYTLIKKANVASSLPSNNFMVCRDASC